MFTTSGFEVAVTSPSGKLSKSRTPSSWTWTRQWRTEEEVLGYSNSPPPRNSESPPKSCQTQPDCENCYKSLNLRRRHTKIFEKKRHLNSKTCIKLQLPPQPLTRRLPPPDPRSLCPLSSTEFVEPPTPRTKFVGTPLRARIFTHFHLCQLSITHMNTHDCWTN